MNNNNHAVFSGDIPREAITKALFSTYDGLYAVDLETSEYECFYESPSFTGLPLERRVKNFFDVAERDIWTTIHPDDQAYVRSMISREAMQAGAEKEKYYTFVCRIIIDGKPMYHRFRVTRALVDDRPYFLISVRNIDVEYRREEAHREELSAMHKKEISHLEVILASAEGYMAANLSQDRVIELSEHLLPAWLPKNRHFPTMESNLYYSKFQKWCVENLIVENRDKYIETSDRNNLIDGFEHGSRRASVSFSMKTASGMDKPCRQVFFLYQDEATGDILAFCVLYDLTEQQRREKELEDLEEKLQMSRIRNFTSQMQPHFLYNALASIQEIVLSDPQYASDLIRDFTIHLRSCIRAMTSDAPIPFSQELANVRAYVNIEKMRFGEKLRVVYDIQTTDFSILPLTVQPIVENAIRHGIHERGESGGTVVVRTAERDDAWVITVEDDGVGFDVAAYRDGIASGQKDSTGIRNILFRLEKVMGASMEIESEIGVGTTVTITLPKGGNGK